mgnify:CR=1 FL=1
MPPTPGSAGVAVGVLVGVALGVWVGVGVCVGTAVAVTVDVAVSAGRGVDVEDGAAVGVMLARAPLPSPPSRECLVSPDPSAS